MAIPSQVAACCLSNLNTCTVIVLVHNNSLKTQGILAFLSCHHPVLSTSGDFETLCNRTGRTSAESFCISPLEVVNLLLSLPVDQCLNGVAIRWCWWQERNKANHQVDEFKFQILRYTNDQKNVNIARRRKLSTQECVRGKPPRTYTVKINIEGAFRDEFRTGGWGAIAKDSAGDSIFVAAGTINTVVYTLQMELMAPVHAIPIAEQYCIGQAIFSTDCLVLKRETEMNGYDLSRLGVLSLHANFLLNFSFMQHSFEYVLRNYKKPDHAQMAFCVGGGLDSHNVWVANLARDALFGC